MDNFFSNTLLSKCRSDATILQSQIIELIKANDKITTDEISKILACDITTVKRNIKKMKGVYIDREGNNRTGHWIILDEPEQISKQTMEPDCSMDYYFFEKNFENDAVIEPQHKSENDIWNELLQDGFSVEMIEDFLSIYA